MLLIIFFKPVTVSKSLLTYQKTSTHYPPAKVKPNKATTLGLRKTSLDGYIYALCHSPTDICNTLYKQSLSIFRVVVREFVVVSINITIS